MLYCTVNHIKISMKALAPEMQVCPFQCVPESLPCFCCSFVLKILCFLESDFNIFNMVTLKLSCGGTAFSSCIIA